MKAKTKPKLGFVKLEGWGKLSDLRGVGKALRRDGEFLIVRTSNPSTGFKKDWKFRLDSGKMAGTNEVAGTKITDSDLLSICQRIGAPLPNVNIAPKEDTNMALATKKKVKGKTLNKNGHKTREEVEETSPGESVNEVIKKRGPGRPKKVIVETDEAVITVEDSLPETKPSPKKGEKVSTAAVSQKGKKGTRGRPRKNPDAPVKEKPVRNSDTPAKRGPKPNYTLPETKKGEVIVIMSEGAYNDTMENHLPNVRSKKTTDEEKALAQRLKDAVKVPVKGVHIVMNKTNAKTFLALSEKLVAAWTETGGVAAAHFKRGLGNTLDMLRETFNLKGGYVHEVKEKAPAKRQSKPLRKAVARKAAQDDEDEDEAPVVKKRGRPAGKKKAGAAKRKSK